jgi:hypothetical protein
VVTRECAVARKMMPAMATSEAKANMYLRLRRRARRWESWERVAMLMLMMMVMQEVGFDGMLEMRGRETVCCDGTEVSRKVNVTTKSSINEQNNFHTTSNLQRKKK